MKASPLIDAGTIELHRNSDNYFAEIEQGAFAPLHRGARDQIESG